MKGGPRIIWVKAKKQNPHCSNSYPTRFTCRAYLPPSLAILITLLLVPNSSIACLSSRASCKLHLLEKEAQATRRCTARREPPRLPSPVGDCQGKQISVPPRHLHIMEFKTKNLTGILLILITTYCSCAHPPSYESGSLILVSSRSFFTNARQQTILQCHFTEPSDGPGM